SPTSLHTDPAPTPSYTLSLHDALPICPPSAAAQFHRLAAGGLYVFECEIIVRVLRRELEDDFDFIAARDCVTVSEQDTIVEVARSEEHTSELQSRFDLVCRLLLEKKK